MPTRHTSLLQLQRRFSSHVPNKNVATKPAPVLWRWRNSLRTRAEHLLLFFQGRERQHHGADAPLLDIFQRRDWAFFKLEGGKLRTSVPPPVFYHDLLDAAARVGALEERIGYKFKDKMTCIHALKLTHSNCPLYHDGTVYKADSNKRLALLGDRVLSLAVCELWFYTTYSNKEHSSMSLDTVSRAALAQKARGLRLEECILQYLPRPTTKHHKNDLAETMEAVLGAIYVDSNHNLTAVMDVIKSIGLGDHQYLKTSGQQSIEYRESKLKEDLPERNNSAQETITKSRIEVKQAELPTWQISDASPPNNAGGVEPVQATGKTRTKRETESQFTKKENKDTQEAAKIKPPQEATQEAAKTKVEQEVKQEKKRLKRFRKKERRRHRRIAARERTIKEDESPIILSVGSLADVHGNTKKEDPWKILSKKPGKNADVDLTGEVKVYESDVDLLMGHILRDENPSSSSNRKDARL